MSEQGMRDPWGRDYYPLAELARWTHRGDPEVVTVRGDWLDLTPSVLADLLSLIAETPHLTWCLFSERLDRFRPALEDVPSDHGDMVDLWLQHGDAPPNVYVGTTVTTQAEADERIPELLAIPARVRVLRVSPRERVDLPLRCESCGYMQADSERHGDHRLCNDESGIPAIGWVVCEGGDYPMHPKWVRSLRDQAEEAGVPFWFSGWGEWVPAEVAAGSAREFWLTTSGTHDRAHVHVGKDKAGRLLDGREWSGVPSCSCEVRSERLRANPTAGAGSSSVEGEARRLAGGRGRPPRRAQSDPRRVGHSRNGNRHSRGRAGGSGGEAVSDDLKPCPFCGGSIQLVGSGHVHWIYCAECESRGPECDRLEDAVAAWNKRPGEEALRAEAEALTKALAVPLCPGCGSIRDKGHNKGWCECRLCGGGW